MRILRILLQSRGVWWYLLSLLGYYLSHHIIALVHSASQNSEIYINPVASTLLCSFIIWNELAKIEWTRRLGYFKLLLYIFVLMLNYFYLLVILAFAFMLHAPIYWQIIFLLMLAIVPVVDIIKHTELWIKFENRWFGPNQGNKPA